MLSVSERLSVGRYRPRHRVHHRRSSCFFVLSTRDRSILRRPGFFTRGNPSHWTSVLHPLVCTLATGYPSITRNCVFTKFAIKQWVSVADPQLLRTAFWLKGGEWVRTNIYSKPQYSRRARLLYCLKRMGGSHGLPLLRRILPLRSFHHHNQIQVLDLGSSSPRVHSSDWVPINN